MSRPGLPLTERLEFWLLKDLNRAAREYAMIADGDRVAVALSGGKDSLTLLRLLEVRRQSAAERYSLVALHVPADARGPLEPHPPLAAWLEEAGIEHEFVPLALPAGEALPLNCQRCAWNRRRALFEAARRAGCNVIAFGHHADDLAQTTLLNLIQHGLAETMAPCREYFDGLLRLVRPLCYTPEKDIRRYTRARAEAGIPFPPPPPLCPRGDKSRRTLARDLLEQAERACPTARTNLLRAGLKGLADSQAD